ncbi:MAG: PEFG-CTERM sorting domain-containing protein [Candidatus Nitrosocaldaceae archaeon]
MKTIAYGVVLALVVSLIMVNTVKIYAQSITVSVDKDEYMTGDTVTVSGKVSEILEGMAITIQLINVNNARFDLDQIMPDEIAADGSFSKEFKLSGSEARLGPSGTWTVRVAYGNTVEETKFKFTATTMPKGLEVTIDGKKYQIDATLTNGVIKSVTADTKNAMLVFEVEMNDDGIFTINLPRDFMDARVNGQEGDDDVYIITLDGQTEFPEESKDDGVRKLTIEVPAGTTEIAVVGTWMVPEFGIIAVFILAAAVGAIIVATKKSLINLRY